MTDKITGKPRGFGFIVFESPDGVAAVLRVNAAVQTVLGGDGSSPVPKRGCLLVLNAGNGREWALLGLLLIVMKWIIPSFPANHQEGWWLST